jgi:hypothetical protein
MNRYLKRYAILLWFAAALCWLPAIAVAGDGKIVRAGADKIDNEYIVVFEDDVLPEQVPELARQVANAHGVRAGKIWSHAIKGFFAVMPEERAQPLSRNPRVKYVEENAPWYLSATHQTNVNPVSCNPPVASRPRGPELRVA